MDAYILQRYPGHSIDTRDEPWKTDQDILCQQSQIVQQNPVMAKQKRRQISEMQGGKQIRKINNRVKRVIVDVPMSANGKEDREMTRGRWKGRKLRKVIEMLLPEIVVPGKKPFNDQTPGSGEPVPLASKVSCPFSMSRAWGGRHPKNVSSGTEHSEASPSSPSAGVTSLAMSIQKPLVIDQRISGIKDTDCDTDSFIEDEECLAEKTNAHQRKQRSSVMYASRAQPKRGNLVNSDHQPSRLPRLVTWDPVTAFPLKSRPI